MEDDQNRVEAMRAAIQAQMANAQFFIQYLKLQHQLMIYKIGRAEQLGGQVSNSLPSINEHIAEMRDLDSMLGDPSKWGLLMVAISAPFLGPG